MTKLQKMILKPRSILIEAIEYEIRSQHLKVYFTNGMDYEYHNVPPELIKDWIDAESWGAYFNAHIRPLGETT